MWVCLFILIQKGYCYRCMTKPVVAIYNVSKTIVCVCFLSEPHSNEYGIRLLNTDDSTMFFCLIYNRKLSVYHFVCARIFFRVVFSSNGQKHHTHILTSVIKLPNCLELVQNKFCRKNRRWTYWWNVRVYDVWAQRKFES